MTYGAVVKRQRFVLPRMESRKRVGHSSGSLNGKRKPRLRRHSFVSWMASRNTIRSENVHTALYSHRRSNVCNDGKLLCSNRPKSSSKGRAEFNGSTRTRSAPASGKWYPGKACRGPDRPDPHRTTPIDTV